MLAIVEGHQPPAEPVVPRGVPVKNLALQPRPTTPAEAVETENFSKAPDSLGHWKKVVRRGQKFATSP